MNQPDLLSRLERLEGYLRQDPQNARLLADTFDLALSAAAWERAEFHLRHALALGLDRPAWRLREAHWLLAQHRWPEARESLLALAGDVAPGTAQAATLVADLAYIDLRLGDFAAGIARLESLLEGDTPAAGLDAAVEQIWLRLLHRAFELERAMAWLRGREALGSLAPSTAGVGSLIALDAGDYEASLRWSTLALVEASPAMEAQVARASLALAEQDPALALGLLQAALAHNGEDGRAWSAVGFAKLLDQDLASARSAFDRAVTFMAGHIGTWHGLGWTALAQRDLPGARRAFDTALALDRNFAESHGAAAIMLALEGDADAARGEVAIALRLDRKSLTARYAEALLSGDASDTESLMRLADRLLGGQRAPLGADMMGLLRSVRPKRNNPA